MPKNRRRDGFIPLSEADWKFCSARLRQEYRDLYDQPHPEMPDTESVDWVEGMKAISKSFSYQFRTGPAESKMRKEVALKLRSGVLQARGLRTKPDLGEIQEFIPSFFFDRAKIEWEKNAVENFGRRFEAVEVRRPGKGNGTENLEITAAAPVKPAALPTLQKKRGRPSAEGAINAAIVALTKQGFDFRISARKQAYEAIRQHLQKAHYDISRGFSDPVLNRCLNRYLLQK